MLLFLFLISLHTIFVFINTIKKGKNMSEKYKKVYKNGTTYHMSETGACRDIDVEDWVEEVSFGEDVTKIWLRKNSKKRFENVKRIHIGKNVYSIEMPNTVFPNVREVTSDRESFPAGRMLTERTSIGKIDLNKTTLLNAFCLRPEEPLDLSGIWGIRTGALVGCCSEKVINSEQIEMVKKSDFLNESNICIEDRTATCGVKMAGSIVVDISDSKDYVIPEDATLIATNVTFPKGSVIDVRCSNESFFRSQRLRSYNSFSLFLNGEGHFDKEEFACLRRNHVELGLQNEEYVKVGDIIYSKDMTELLHCDYTSTGNCETAGKVMIPDTVKIIAESAFENCGGITEIVIPDSVTEVGRYAFRFCDGVEKMTLGKHIKYLGHECFEYMKSLTKLDIPGSVTRVEPICSFCTDLENIKINEGVQSVDFSNPWNHIRPDVLEIPSTIKAFTKRSLIGIHTVVLHTNEIPKDLLAAMHDYDAPAANGKYKYNYAHEKAIISEILCIKTPRRRIYIPAEATDRNFDIMNDLLNRYGVYAPANFFQYCRTTRQKLPLAFMEWQDVHETQTQNYIRRNRKRLIQDLIEENMEDGLVMALKDGIFQANEIKDYYDMIENTDMQIAKAYALDMTGENSKKNVFRL